MRNSLKVAKWEINRNMKNKSFIISLLSTPIIFLAFMFVPMLFNSFSADKNVNVYMHDELGVWDAVSEAVKNDEQLNWTLIQSQEDESIMLEGLPEMEQSVYIVLTEEGLAKGQMNMYMSDDMDKSFGNEVGILDELLRQVQIESIGLTDVQKATIAHRVVIVPVYAGETGAIESELKGTVLEAADPMKRIVPGVFAGIILFSIVMTGMMIFQSASQEKKEKVAEIILSSLTPTELMQGKIIGYFILGITQVFVWLVVAFPVVLWKFDFPIVEYLFVPETLLLLFIAFSGYLLFAAIFVGIGATVEDMTATSNFQGMVMMLPFLPLVFIGPILSDPSGMVAKVGSFIPITAPSILLFRLSVLEEWPWLEIIIALVILVVSIWIFMKLAGKIFKMGILMYGKNATPKEIWKWMWA
ncbi:ABC transporter permease [Sporosarcina limicola]|uniref:ABC-2 type transport system permease protein n=1 Tax=Sporosarcina limicola TaxID=34101 RepID=A0A927R5T5_9BACL|nr:ABC transporter permease [Sporosarcina limicola]MBE1554249.1 ABC-2 type transport system permease protein [Sporosarcina limicola]